MVSKCQLSVLLPEGQEAAVEQTFHLVRSNLFLPLNIVLTSLYFAHSCAKHRPQLLPSGSEATPHVS